MKKRFVLLAAIAIFLGINVFSQNIITTFSGNGGKNTRPFYVPDEWEIQWSADGDIFQLYLYDKIGNLIGLPANQLGSGNGDSYQPVGGQYYLQVNAIGNWTIKIIAKEKPIQNDTQSSSGIISSFSGNGGKNTKPFDVPNGWEIQWTTNGSIFQLYLYDVRGNLIGLPANQVGSGSGDSYQALGGRYYLQVNAIGTWKIIILKVN